MTTNEITNIVVSVGATAAPCCAPLATATSGGGHPAAGVPRPPTPTPTPTKGCHVIAGMVAKPLIGHVIPALLGTRPEPNHVAVLTLTGGGLGAFGLVALPDPARLRHRLGSELAEDMAITVPLLDLGAVWAGADRAVIVGWGEPRREPDLRRIADLAPVPVDAAVRVHDGRWWRLDCPAPGTCSHLPCTGVGEPLDDGSATSRGRDHHREPDVPVDRVGDRPEGGGDCAVECDVSHPDRVTTSGAPIHARRSCAAHHPDSADSATLAT